MTCHVGHRLGGVLAIPLRRAARGSRRRKLGEGGDVALKVVSTHICPRRGSARPRAAVRTRLPKCRGRGAGNEQRLRPAFRNVLRVDCTRCALSAEPHAR